LKVVNILQSKGRIGSNIETSSTFAISFFVKEKKLEHVKSYLLSGKKSSKLD